ncbi:MAG: inorganic phosphate transporter [Actinomycetota bacterium]|nr:inorganic phosphate transporter [Actinomycetota bacterium]
MTVVALVVIVGFAFMLGVSDAPNASASLLAARAASYPAVMTFSFIMHVVGGLVAGQAVALTMSGLVHLPAGHLASACAAGGAASIGFTLVATRRGIPVSASIALVAGLAGAAATMGGWQAVGWGGFHGLRPYGVIGTLAAIVVSPVVGAAAAAGLRRALGRALRRASRSMGRPLTAATWLTAGLVALADGSNDGQKAMGLATALLVATGHLSRFVVPLWVVAMVAVVLAAGTAAGGRRIVRTVSSRFYRGDPTDGLAAQGASAATVLAAAWLGAPVSTSTVVASGMIGVGAARRRRHVHWPTVRTVVMAWAVTVPACAVIGAVLVGFGRAAGVVG